MNRHRRSIRRFEKLRVMVRDVEGVAYVGILERSLKDCLTLTAAAMFAPGNDNEIRLDGEVVILHDRISLMQVLNT